MLQNSFKWEHFFGVLISILYYSISNSCNLFCVSKVCRFTQKLLQLVKHLYGYSKVAPSFWLLNHMQQFSSTQKFHIVFDSFLLISMQNIFPVNLWATGGQISAILLLQILRERRRRLSLLVVLAKQGLVFSASWAPGSVIWRWNRGPGAVSLHGISRNNVQIVSGLGDHR